MAAQKQKPINLLVQNDFEHSAFGKILAWLLSTGRVIVILTELVVIIAFISRFWLDKTLTDLSEANVSKKTQIEASMPFENDFKSVQKRLSIIKQLDAKKANAESKIVLITQLLPSDLLLTSISVSDNRLTIQGESLSEGSIGSLISSLDNSKQFTKTTLSNIALENKAQQLINFKLTSDLVTQEGNQ